MGNCCSNEEAKVQDLGVKPLNLNEPINLKVAETNYGPLKRDEESIPNTVCFGRPVCLEFGED